MNAWLDARKNVKIYARESFVAGRMSDRRLGRMPEGMSETMSEFCVQVGIIREFVRSSLVHMMCHQPRKPTRKSKWPKLHRAWAKQHKATRLKGSHLLPPFWWSWQNAGFLLRSNFHLRRGPCKRTMFWHLSKCRRCVRNRLDHLAIYIIYTLYIYIYIFQFYSVLSNYILS